MVLNKKILVLFIAHVLIFEAAAQQVNRYMVFFKDKNGTPYSVNQPSAFLSEKAITRRLNQGIDITAQDLPVNPAYISSVRETGAEVFFRSKWFNGVLVQCSESLIADIKALQFVDTVQFVAPLNKLMREKTGRTRFNLRKRSSKDGIETQSQLNMIGLTNFHQNDFNGEGVTIAIFDAGFAGANTTQPFAHLFANDQVNLDVSYDFVYNTNNVFQYDDHGTEVFSVIAAEVPDVFNGGASGANFQLYVTEDADDEYRIEEYNWAFAAERADSAGADVINSSLGYYDFDDPSMNYTKTQMDGKTAAITRAAQWASERGMVVVCSAGNEGNIASWRIISAPADAEGVLAVANVDASGNRSPSSSIGPTADGRIKPDIAARGAGVRVINSQGNLSSASGTSLSAPLITSLVACVWQKYPELTSEEVVALIKASGSQAANPDNFLGYGIPNYHILIAVEEQRDQDDIFVVFINQSEDTLVISPKNPDSTRTCFAQLIDSMGRTITDGSVNFSATNRLFQTDISTLAAGMYFVRIRAGDKKFVYKVIRQ